MVLNNVLAFAGEYSSGKDYFAEYLGREFGTVRLSFSDEVRRLSTELFPWLPFFVPPEVKDLPFEHEQNPNGLTPRDIWLTVGKVRDVDPHYFVRKFEENQYARTRTMMNRSFVITDFRTPQEYDFLKANGIPIIKVCLKDRTGLKPSAFEAYIRNFINYQGIFEHQKDGTEEFAAFFKTFKKNHLEA